MFLKTNSPSCLNNQLSNCANDINGLFLIIFSLIPPKLHCLIYVHLQLTSLLLLLITLYYLNLLLYPT